MRLLIAAAFTAALTSAAAQAQGRCQLEHARYVLRGAPAVTAHFQDIPKHPDWLTNVALDIEFAKEHDSFWWLFDQGSARFLNMISTTDMNRRGWTPPSDTNGKRGPLGETHVWFATPDYSLSYEMPKAGQTAPEHIFIPDLEELMWYRASPQRYVPTAFFDLVDCR